jgi:hypothetical protein
VRANVPTATLSERGHYNRTPQAVYDFYSLLIERFIAFYNIQVILHNEVKDNRLTEKDMVKQND